MSSRAWRCGVCGYVHRQDEPPEWCPVCGSARKEFEPFVEEAASAGGPEVREWRCLNCRHVHSGAHVPPACPVCGAAADQFEPYAAPAASAGTGGQERILVVGAGIAGVTAAEAARSVSSSAEITLISKEPALPYYRLNLTRYLAGEITKDDLPMHPAAWYDEKRIRLRLDAEVLAIALSGLRVELSGGESEPFDKLILTNGAHPFMPPIPGSARQGVTALRTVVDADRILADIRPGQKCVCIGGGILGLETAGALARRGADVTVLEGYGWLLPRQLNERAGLLLERRVAAQGIRLRKKARTAEIIGDERARGVLLEDKGIVPADLVVVTTGVRPNSYLARQAGLEVNQGIVVDNHLAASHPAVYAAGDVAEHRGTVYGIWAPSMYQGSIAGTNAAGGRSEFGGIPRSNTLKVLGIELFSIGVFEPADASYRVVDRDEELTFFRFVFHDNLLCGAILLGDTAIAAPLKKAIEKKMDFSDLLSRKPDAAAVVECVIQKAG